MSATISIAAARLLGPQQLGHYNFVLWVAGLGSFLMTFGVASATTRFAAEFVGRGEIGRALGVVHTTLRFQVVLAAVVAVTGCAIIVVLVPETHRPYSALVVLSVAPQALMSIFAGGINATEDSFHNVWPSISSNLVNLSASIGALVLGWSLVGLAGALLLSRSVDCVLRYLAFRTAWHQRFPQERPEQVPLETQARIRRFCLQGTVLWLLNAVVWNRSDMIFLQGLSSAEQVAFFSMSFNLVTQVLLVPQVFLTAAGLSMGVQYGRDPAHLAGMTTTVLRYLLMLAAPLLFGLAAVSAALIPLVYGEPYRPAAPVLTLAALLGVARAALGPAQRLLVIGERQAILIGVGIVTGLLNVVLDLWWIPRQHALGATLASGTAQALAAAGVWLAATRLFAVAVPWRFVGKLLGVGLIMAAVAATVTLSLPPVLGLTLAIPGGAALYVLLVRASRLLEPADHSRLERVGALLPTPYRPAFSALLRWLVPSPANPAPSSSSGDTFGG